MTSVNSDYPSNKSSFKEELHSLSSVGNINGFLIFKDNRLCNVDAAHYAVEKMKAIFNPQDADATNKDVIANKTTEFLMNAKNNKWIDEEDLSNITALANLAGIIPDNPNDPLLEDLIMDSIVGKKESELLNKMETDLQKMRVGRAKFYAKKYPNEFKTIISDLMMKNLDNVDFLEFFKKTGLKYLKKITTDQDVHGWTLVHYVNNLEVLKYLSEIIPEEFKKSILTQDIYGRTPVYLGAQEGNLEFLKFLSKIAPEEFKKSLLIKDQLGRAPIHMAVLHGSTHDILSQWLAGVEPNALTVLSSEDKFTTPLLIKKITFPDEKFDFLKVNSCLDKLHQEIRNRTAVSHAFHLSGTSRLIEASTKETLNVVSLEGNEPQNWFYLMHKDFVRFKEVYPDLLSLNQQKILEKIFDKGKAFARTSIEDKLKVFASGELLVIDSGFKGHSVVLYLKKLDEKNSIFAICNRGAASNKPIEYCYIDPKYITFDLLKKINDISNEGSEEDYEKLFFEFLPTLGIKKTQEMSDLEELNPFPDQTVGNCSFVSGITAVYAALLTNELLENRNPDIPFNVQVKSVIEKCKVWLGFQQICFLERLIKPKHELFEKDHALIVNGLRKARLIPLDNLCSDKLRELTKTYINSLDEYEQTKTSTDLLYWTMLASMESLKESFFRSGKSLDHKYL